MLSEDIRKTMGLEINDAVIVFDEAHNIESAAESSFSKELLLEDVDYTESYFKNAMVDEYFNKSKKILLQSIKLLKSIKNYSTFSQSASKKGKREIETYSTFSQSASKKGKREIETYNMFYA